MEQIKTKGEITGKRILKSFLKENIGILVVLCLLVLILSFGTEVFATKDNILSVQSECPLLLLRGELI